MRPETHPTRGPRAYPLSGACLNHPQITISGRQSDPAARPDGPGPPLPTPLGLVPTARIALLLGFARRIWPTGRPHLGFARRPGIIGLGFARRIGGTRPNGWVRLRFRILSREVGPDFSRATSSLIVARSERSCAIS